MKMWVRFCLLSTIYCLLSTVNASDFMGVEEIKPGMKGYGLTVFKGTKIDTFNVEIIEVMKNKLPKGDIILVKLSGKYIDKTGIISGMSGSPIYIYEKTKGERRETKLIGALAYNYALFPIEHYGGVTPIAEMLSPTASPNRPIKGFSQIKLPFNLAGYNDSQLLEEINKEFPSFSAIKVQAGSGHQNDSLIPCPGSPLTIPLVTGDVNWCTMGTCTFREGDKIWGFGHPFAGFGEVELPFSTGYIYSTIPSSYASYKLGASTKIVGTIRNDNSTGISGTIGDLPHLIEIDLTVNSNNRNQEIAPTNNFHYQIVKEKTLLGLLFRAVTLNSIAKSFKLSGDVTISASLNISGSGDFKFSNLFTGNVSKIVREISNVFSSVQDNPFQKVDIGKVSIDLAISDTVRFAKIEELWVGKEKVKTGDDITLLLVFSTYKGGIAKEYISLKIPHWVKKGKLTLSVRSGELARKKMAGKVKTYDEFIRWLSKSPTNDELVVHLMQEGASKHILGESFESLPPSFAGLFKETGKETRVLEKRITTKWVVAGEKSVKLEVE